MLRIAAPVRLFKCISAGVALGAAVLSSNAAIAQEVTAAPSVGTNFDRLRTAAVADRIPAGYESIPLTVGSFVVTPELDLRGYAIDNAYVAQTNRQSNIAAIIAPSATVTSNWSRHQLGLAAGGTFLRSLNRPSENYDAFQTRLAGRYDISRRWYFYGYASFNRQAQDRSDPSAITSALTPVTVDLATTAGRLTWQNNRLRVSAEGRYATVSYSPFTQASGIATPVFALDRSEVSVSGRADYAVGPNLALVLLLQHWHYDYRGAVMSPTIDRSGNKDQIEAGVSFEFTDLLRGEVTLGYVDRRYTSPAFQAIKGLGARASVEYFPSRLTSLRLDAVRAVQETGNSLAPQYLRSSVTATLDHELYRNVVLTASATYLNSRFYQPDRTERRIGESFGAKWILNRTLSVDLIASHLNSNADTILTGRNFSVNSASIGVKFKF